ncbi:conjugal transfer protein TraH [Methylibium petroleiphilum]|uniref:Sex pilus assembly protein n=1 Tax=Methylibium petroleiphilum (strain ATCC BAA-1232 / LMG 22953 / PM1) TaxID=420662 RepID=A2SNL1_METPP|nr:conjugal transfer protein TraH [Methylibium petroleiphilum]ABM97150.1 sex pilus assembly protein [Methylibium petroleiphilum PM1]
MKINLRILAAATALAASLFASPAHAGLQDALDGMFMSNSTAPQAFSSQSRGGFVGGSVAMRTPVRNINLVAFDPPRLAAGCGGIDMFGGSFSFINADQLVALFRQIAANSVGLAFKAAIDYINPALGKQMQEFQAKMQALNENMRNTCAIANQVVKSFSDPSARKDMVDGATAAAEAAKGGFDDLWSGMTSFFTTPNSATRTADAGGYCAECGNPVWKALVSSNSGVLLGDPTTSTDSNANRTNEIIMSLMGTVIMSTTKADTTTTGGVTQKDTGTVKPYLLTLFDLRDGSSSGKPFKIWTCSDGYAKHQCTQLTETAVTFDGMKGYVNKMLFGYADGLASGVPTAGSIIGKLESCSTTSCGFTQAQKDFLNSVQTPTLALVRKVQAVPGASQHVATRLVDQIANEIAVKYGEAAVRAIRMSFTEGKFPKPPEIVEAEKQRLAELSELRQENTKLTEQTMAVRAYVAAVVSDNPAVFARIK